MSGLFLIIFIIIILILYFLFSFVWAGASWVGCERLSVDFLIRADISPSLTPSAYLYNRVNVAWSQSFTLNPPCKTSDKSLRIYSFLFLLFPLSPFCSLFHCYFTAVTDFPAASSFPFPAFYCLSKPSLAIFIQGVKTHKEGREKRHFIWGEVCHSVILLNSLLLNHLPS